MPRSGSPPYNYSLPTGTAAVSGQIISSVAYNAFLSDLVNAALNAAWPVSYGGTGTTDGSALVPDGSAATPALRFQNETNTGFYRAGAGQIGVSILGANVGTFTASGLAITQPISITGSTAGFTPFQGISTNAGAAAGPIDESFRDSASPAVSDILGQYIFYGRDSAGNKQEYASIQAVITDPVSTTEDATLDIYTVIAGVRTLVASLGSTILFPNAPVGVAGGGTGANTLTSKSVLIGNGTSAVTGIAPGTSGNVLTSNGTDWASTAPAANGQPIPSGSTYAIGDTVIALQNSGGTIASGGTTAGSNIMTIGNTGAATLAFNGGTQSGTWKNVSAISLPSNNGFGRWVRTA